MLHQQIERYYTLSAYIWTFFSRIIEVWFIQSLQQVECGLRKEHIRPLFFERFVE